jgi:hypothetical protein
MEENDEIGVRFVEFKATLMNYLSSTRQPVSAVKQDLYQIAVIAGKAIWSIPFLIVIGCGAVVIAPLWLGEKIGSLLLTNSKDSARSEHVMEMG